MSEAFPASRLQHGANAIDLSLGGFVGNFRISDEVIWFQSEPVNSPSMTIDNNGNIFVGGNNADGDLMLLRPDVGNANAANATIHLDGGAGDARFGGNLSNGKVSIYPNHVVAGGGDRRFKRYFCAQGAAEPCVRVASGEPACGEGHGGAVTLIRRFGSSSSREEALRISYAP